MFDRLVWVRAGRMPGMRPGDLVDYGDTCALDASLEHRAWMRVWMDRMVSVLATTALGVLAGRAVSSVSLRSSVIRVARPATGLSRIGLPRFYRSTQRLAGDPAASHPADLRYHRLWNRLR